MSEGKKERKKKRNNFFLFRSHTVVLSTINKLVANFLFDGGSKERMILSEREFLTYLKSQSPSPSSQMLNR